MTDHLRRARPVPRPVLLVLGAAAGLALGVVSVGVHVVTTDPQVRNEVTDLSPAGGTDPAGSGASTPAAGESSAAAESAAAPAESGAATQPADEPVVVDPAPAATDQAVVAEEPVPAEPVTEPLLPTAAPPTVSAPTVAPESTPEPVGCPDNWAGVNGVCVPPPTQTESNGG